MDIISQEKKLVNKTIYIILSHNTVPSPQWEGVTTKLAWAREVVGETPTSVAQTT